MVVTINLGDNGQEEILLEWDDTNGRKLQTKIDLITTCSRPKTLTIKINNNTAAHFKADQKGGFISAIATLITEG